MKEAFTYEYAMTIRTQRKADAWFKKLISRLVKRFGGMTRAELELIQRSNLGYFAGYYDAATRARVERLFKCEHPIFGSIAKHGQPTPEQAFKMGLKMGKKAKEKGKQHGRRR